MPGRWLVLLLAGGSIVAGAGERLEYRVTPPAGYSAGSVSGEDAYDQISWGDRDRERMLEVAPGNRRDRLPPPVVVPYANAPEVQEVRIEKAPPPAPLSGEDAVFERIRQSPPLERCLMVPGAECDLTIDAGASAP